MRAVVRKRSINKAVRSNLPSVAQAIHQVLDEQYNDIMLELVGDGELEKMGWPDWFDRFTTTVKSALARVVSSVSAVETEFWADKGENVPEVDPWYVIAQYENRTGHKISDIATTTRDKTLEAVADWYNSPEQTQAELAIKLRSIYSEERAASIAYTESSFLTSQVARESMLQLGLRLWNWDIGSGACESICLPKAAHNPYDIDDDMPPGHPYCDCGVVYVNDDDVNKLLKAFNEGDHKRGKGGKFEYAGGRRRDRERAERRERDKNIRPEYDVVEEDKKVVSEQATKILGSRDELDNFVNMLGAKSGDKVSLSGSERPDAHILSIEIRGKDFDMNRTLIRNKQTGETVLYNEAFYIKEDKQGQGLGTKLFAQEVDWARSNGVSYIRTRGSSDDGDVGYYTWPRLGFDSDLTPDFKAKAEGAGFTGASKISDLMKTPEGRKYWKENGSGKVMRFDLSEGSHSLKVLEAYKKERGLNE